MRARSDSGPPESVKCLAGDASRLDDRTRAEAMRPAAREQEPPAPSSQIESRQLLALFGYSLVIWSLGNGTLPLLPRFAEHFGANEVTAGIYLSIAYGAIAAGALAAGWIAHRYGHHRRMMLLAGVAGAPLVLATSFVTTFLQLVVLTSAVWWMGGMAVALTSIVGGLSAGPAERGRVLGTIALGAPAGSIIGGLGVGPLADALGYSGMWVVLGFAWLLCPVAGLFVRDVGDRPARRTESGTRRSGLLTPAFLLLFICGIFASLGSFIGSLGRTYAMGDLGFSQTDLTSTVFVAGAATLLPTAVLGWLSDRLGRMRFLALSYAAGLGGLLVYAWAVSLVSFWIAAALLAFVSYVSTGVGSALVVDLVDRPTVGLGLALFGETGWIGAIVGFAAGGVAFATLGNANAFLLGGLFVGLALLLLPAIAWAKRSPGIPVLPSPSRKA